MTREQLRDTIQYCLEHGSMGGKDCRMWYSDHVVDHCPNKDCNTGCVVTPLRDVVRILTPIAPVESYVGDALDMRCGKCGYNIWRQHNYCPNCGREILWG